MPSDGILHAVRGETAVHGIADVRPVLRMLVVAHRQLTEATNDQANQLRALLLRGDNADRDLGRSGLGHGILSTLAHRPLPRDATDRQADRHANIQRLAKVVLAYRKELCDNRDQMAAIVNELAPGVIAQHGVGPLKAAKAMLDATQDTVPHSEESNAAI
jgi:transposase